MAVLRWSVLLMCCSCYASFADGVGDGRDAVTADRGDVDSADVAEVPDCSACPPPPDAGWRPPICPSECTGGCDAGVCVIDCNGDLDDCGRMLTCPGGMACRVECGATSSCGVTTIVLPPDAPGEVACDGRSSCGSVDIYCPRSHACTVRCDGQASCQVFNLWCGEGPCNLECDPSTDGHSPCQQCEDSCCCTTNCRQYRWCPNDT